MSNGTKSWNEHQRNSPVELGLIHFWKFISGYKFGYRYAKTEIARIKGQLQKARETLNEAEKRLEYFRDLQYEHPEPVIWDAFDDACMVMIEETLKETEGKEG